MRTVLVCVSQSVVADLFCHHKLIAHDAYVIVRPQANVARKVFPQPLAAVNRRFRDFYELNMWSPFTPAITHIVRVTRINLSALMALLALCASPVQAADKYETYGTLSLFGKNQWGSSCFPAGTLASVRLAMKDSRFFTPQNLSVVEGATSLRYGFELGPGEDRFSAAAPVSPFALEVWRTYPSIGAGTWDFVSLQKLSNGERLSDAIRWSSDRVANPCLPHRLSSAEVLAGDMQVSTVGSPFAVS